MWATASLAVLCALSGSLALPPSPSSTTTPTPTPTPTPAPAPSPTPTPAATAAAAADSTAAETTLHRAPWQQTVPDAPGKAASGDVEIIRSIELDLVFDDNENGSHSTSSTVSERLNEYGGGRVDTSRFKPSPAIPFRPEDVLLATSSDVNHIPCKEIRTRSIPKENEPDNDFDFPSRLLLGRVLLRSRAGDSAESASVRQSRVLDFQPIHTSKNDYPAETVPRRTATAAAAARRLAARTRARNLANQTQTATSPKTPVPAVRSGVSAPTTGEFAGSSASTTAAPTTPPPPSTEAPLTTGPGEGVAAAASSLEFGAKTTHAGERGPAKYRVTSTPRPTVPVLAPTYAPPRAPSPPPAPRAAASAEAGEEGGAGAESVQEESGDPYSTVSIQRGSVDPLPYAPPRDVHLVPLRVPKQPTQVIFIQPYAPTDLKQPPSAPADAPPAHATAHQPPFDTHRWVPVYVQEAYVPLLVEPRRQPHLHHLDAHHHHHHQQQHHALPIAFSENRHTLGDFSSVALQYPSEAWSWTSQQHSTPSSFSGESSISDRNYIR